MAKMYAGKPPSEEDGWQVIARPIDGDGLQWGIFVQRQPHSDDWVTCKVVVIGRAEGKANYWFAKNIKTGAIGFPRDLAIMRENRPKLHEVVQIALDGINN